MINLKDPNWRCLGPERTKERGVWPNRLWHNKSTKEGALVVVQSNQWGDYACSQAGVETILNGLKHALSAGFVVLQNRNGQHVACKPIHEVEAQVQNVPPKTGGLYGPYWWLREDLTLTDSMVGSRETTDDDIPY
jgi:hypothetical protein